MLHAHIQAPLSDVDANMGANVYICMPDSKKNLKNPTNFSKGISNNETHVNKT